MQGFLFLEYKRFLQQKYGLGIWDKILESSGHKNARYNTFDSYPNEELGMLIGVAAKLTQQSPATVLEDFGFFVTPTLLRAANHKIPTTWDMMMMMENVQKIFANIWSSTLTGNYPTLVCTKTKADEFSVLYKSDRKLCPMGKGMIRSVANHYGKGVRITESTCMLRGDAECKMTVAIQDAK